jgi:phage terminase Nu1 subunit (DNA packaging protein)
MSIDVNALCSSKELAAIVGCSTRQIDALTTEGVLKAQLMKGKQRFRKYRLGPSVQAYGQHERASITEQCSTRNGSTGYELARTARMRALAQVEQMKARELAGELISRAVVASAFAQLATVTKSHVLHIPSRCARLLVGQTDFSTVRGVLTAECRRSLHEIAVFDPDKIPNKKAARSAQTNGVDGDDDDDQL